MINAFAHELEKIAASGRRQAGNVVAAPEEDVEDWEERPGTGHAKREALSEDHPPLRAKAIRGRRPARKALSAHQDLKIEDEVHGKAQVT